jgi:hypothetical protein
MVARLVRGLFPENLSTYFLPAMTGEGIMHRLGAPFLPARGFHGSRSWSSRVVARGRRRTYSFGANQDGANRGARERVRGSVSLGLKRELKAEGVGARAEQEGREELP